MIKILVPIAAIVVAATPAAAQGFSFTVPTPGYNQGYNQGYDLITTGATNPSTHLRGANGTKSIGASRVWQIDGTILMRRELRQCPVR